MVRPRGRSDFFLKQREKHCLSLDTGEDKAHFFSCFFRRQYVRDWLSLLGGSTMCRWPNIPLPLPFSSTSADFSSNTASSFPGCSFSAGEDRFSSERFPFVSLACGVAFPSFARKGFLFSFFSISGTPLPLFFSARRRRHSWLGFLTGRETSPSAGEKHGTVARFLFSLPAGPFDSINTASFLPLFMGRGKQAAEHIRVLSFFFVCCLLPEPISFVLLSQCATLWSGTPSPPFLPGLAACFPPLPISPQEFKGDSSSAPCRQH